MTSHNLWLRFSSRCFHLHFLATTLFCTCFYILRGEMPLDPLYTTQSSLGVSSFLGGSGSSEIPPCSVTTSSPCFFTSFCAFLELSWSCNYCCIYCQFFHVNFSHIHDLSSTMVSQEHARAHFSPPWARQAHHLFDLEDALVLPGTSHILDSETSISSHTF